jgi:trk system potassium uptake protein
MAQVTGKLVQYPARVSFAVYLALIAVGTMLLATPITQAGGTGREPISLLDAVFTATSAACVTGLAVRSTGHDFSFWGQFVIMLLIQLGGIGIMTVTTYLMFTLGNRENLRHRAVVTETLGAEENSDLRWILSHVIVFTLACEAIGFGLLLIHFWQIYPPSMAIWSAWFHSVSAFCNGGFSLNDDSLMAFRDNGLVNFTICGLIMVGGIGFPVLWDIRRQIKWIGRGMWDRLRLHTKLMLVSSAALWLMGFGFMIVLEWNFSLKHLSFGGKLLAAMFQSVTLRTAGFNTVDFSQFTNAMLFVSILLMMIGAGPGSTGGGIKVSTFVVLLLRARSTFAGYDHVQVFRRTISSSTINKAMAASALFISVGALALMVLMIMEQASSPHPELKGAFLEAMFEVISALGTVGLSIGLTAILSPTGKVVIIVLMFIGRIGPISIFAALAKSHRKQYVELAHEEPLIG